MKKIKLSTIKKSENNPRKISKNNLEKLKKSISSFSQMMEMRPLVIDENFVLLGGNQRFRALQELGYKEIPNNWVIQKKGLTEDQKKEFLIRDNTHYGDWDFDILKQEWESFELNDWGLNFKWENTEDNKSKQDQMISLDENHYDTDFQKLAGYHTAINRKSESTPIAFLKKNKLISGSILDYGCGMDNHDYEKFDPMYNPEYSKLNKTYDNVLCNYVFNVIPLEHNRFELLRVLKTLLKSNGNLFVSIFVNSYEKEENKKKIEK